MELATLTEEQVLVEPEEEAPADPMEPQEMETGLVLVPNDDGDGLVVVDIVDGSIAAEKGFAPGDVILQANSIAVNTVADFEDAMQAVKDAGRNTMLIKTSRDGNSRFVGLPLE